MEYPGGSVLVDKAVESLHEMIKENKLTPPIMVAHSMSSFIAQKYLESYALRALIIVNPIPPNTSSGCMTTLFEKWKCSYANSVCTNTDAPLSSVLNFALRDYYGIQKVDSGNIELNVDNLVGDELLGAAATVSRRAGTAVVQPYIGNIESLHMLMHGRGKDDQSVNLERGIEMCIEMVAIF